MKKKEMQRRIRRLEAVVFGIIEFEPDAQLLDPNKDLRDELLVDIIKAAGEDFAESTTIAEITTLTLDQIAAESGGGSVGEDN